MTRVKYLAIAMTGIATQAGATSVTVTVQGADGRPLRDAVVSIRSQATPAGTPARFAWPMQITQKDIAFSPYVLVVPQGATVTFPNKDKVRHQVYSFSKAKKFELKLYGRDETRSIRFDVPGTVALGCNIHDEMSAFIRVVDTPFAGRTDAQGRLTIDGIPGGGATITVWHPEAKAKNGEFVAPLPLPASGAVTKIVTMRTSG